MNLEDTYRFFFEIDKFLTIKYFPTYKLIEITAITPASFDDSIDNICFVFKK